MRHRTLTLLATPAVLGAMTVAVPALAGISGHSARSSTKCFIAHVAKHRVRECLIRGPRGFTGPVGPRGLQGTAGKNGINGTNGKNGINGTNGTARAYGVVMPTSPTEAHLVAGPTFNLTSVSEPSEGVYCITPATSIEVAKEAPVASQEVSYGSSTLGFVAVNAQHTHCPAGTLEVDTSTTAGTPSDSYAFTVVVP